MQYRLNTLFDVLVILLLCKTFWEHTKWWVRNFYNQHSINALFKWHRVPICCYWAVMNNFRKYANSISVESKNPKSRNFRISSESQINFHGKLFQSLDHSKSLNSSPSFVVKRNSTSSSISRNGSLNGTCIWCSSTDMGTFEDSCHSLNQSDSNTRPNTLAAKPEKFCHRHKKLTAKQINDLLQYGPFQNKEKKPETLPMTSPCYSIDEYTSQSDRQDKLEIGQIKKEASN